MGRVGVRDNELETTLGIAPDGRITLLEGKFVGRRAAARAGLEEGLSRIPAGRGAGAEAGDGERTRSTASELGGCAEFRRRRRQIAVTIPQGAGGVTKR